MLLSVEVVEVGADLLFHEAGVALDVPGEDEFFETVQPVIVVVKVVVSEQHDVQSLLLPVEHAHESSPEHQQDRNQEILLARPEEDEGDHSHLDVEY